MEGQKIILLSAKIYSMKDEQGRLIEGVSCWYYPGEDLKPYDGGNGSKGQVPLKASLPVEKAVQIKQVPGIYEMTFKMVPGSNNSLKLKADGVQFVSEVQ